MIELERDGLLFVITLGDGADTIDPPWQSRMLEVLATIEADCDGDCALVLTGQGKFFSRGPSVELVMGLAGEERAHFGRSMMEIMGRLVVLPVPTIAAVNGHASGAGAFLALACDYRIMRSDRGWFCLPEVDFGVPIDPRMMDLLKARVSPQVARDAVLSGRRYGGEDALAAGFADALASDGDLLIDAKKRAAELATKERGIFGTLKRTLYADVAASFGIAGKPRDPIEETQVAHS